MTFNTLDITSYKQKGQELFDAIQKEIKSLAKGAILVDLPDSIRMTQAQYESLMKLSRLDTMFHSEDRMFKTPYNIMEVRVNNPKLTFKEAMSLDDTNFNEWENSNV